MAQYMIHAYPKRMWYVENYLIPSMLEQGIEENQITVYNDTEKKGNLKACMDAFSQCVADGGTWHLQDDVCICRDFKQRTEEFDDGIVCGFSSAMYDGTDAAKLGKVTLENMWFSFPCIRIPNDYAINCAEWVLKYLIGNPVYRVYWEPGVNDDWSFRQYLRTCHKNVTAINLAPNLVDHVDYLLGGGSGKQRTTPCRSQYWDDKERIRQLEVKIKCGMQYQTS